jgi:predicted outer membrane protein
MRLVVAIAFLILAGALAVAALHGEHQSPSTSPPGTSAQDSSFLESRQRFNLAEQSFGQIAQDRGQSSSTTQLATTTANDHDSAETKFMSLANQLGVKLPTSPSAVQQAEADQLKSVASSSFDLAYAQNQVAGHQESIADTQQEIDHGSNSDVVSYARTYLSLEQSHLEEAQANLNALNGNSSVTDNGSTPTAVPGGSPSAVPAGTGGLAARHQGTAIGWEIALVIGVALAAAGAVIALRSRYHEVGSRHPVSIPLAATGSVAGVALASIAAAYCLIIQAGAGGGPHAFGDPAERGAQAGADEPTSGHRATPDRPAMLALPSVDVTAPVIAVGVSKGNLQVPDDPAQVGWWAFSAEAGAGTGSVIMDGHVDTASGGPGALYRMGIGKLQLGDRITVTTTRGHQVNYRIYAQSVYVKAAGLPADIFAATHEPRLVLITCGGAFDSAGKTYADNVVVYARPT